MSELLTVISTCIILAWSESAGLDSVFWPYNPFERCISQRQVRAALRWMCCWLTAPVEEGKVTAEEASGAAACTCCLHIMYGGHSHFWKVFRCWESKRTQMCGTHEVSVKFTILLLVIASLTVLKLQSTPVYLLNRTTASMSWLLEQHQNPVGAGGESDLQPQTGMLRNLSSNIQIYIYRI